MDCPGQIELYSHLPIMHNLVRNISLWGYRVTSVFLLDALYVIEPSKFISGCMLSLSCMLQLETPHMNVITKCDIADKEQIQAIIEADNAWIVHAMDTQSNGKLKALTEGICSIIDNYMLISFVMLDNSDEESIENVLGMADHIMQYGEDIEPKEPIDIDCRDDDES